MQSIVKQVVRKKFLIYITLLFATLLLVSFSIRLFTIPQSTKNSTTIVPTENIPLPNTSPDEEKDNAIKNTILQTTLKGYHSGIIYESQQVRIEYVRSADIFLAEILTADVSTAQNEGNGWFLSQGMSQKGICNLPLQFYLNNEIAQQSPSAKDHITILPECQAQSDL